MDVAGVPLLLGITTLRRLEAVLDVDRCMAVFVAVDAGLAIDLKRSRSGHLLIDLKGDWMSEGTRLDSLPQQIVTPPPVQEKYFGEAYVVQLACESARGPVTEAPQRPEPSAFCDQSVHVVQFSSPESHSQEIARTLCPCRRILARGRQ